MSAHEIRIESMVASRDQQPYVVVKWGEEAGQLTPSEARAHALKVLEAAEAAETDAFLVSFLLHRLEVDLGRALHILQDFRGYRAVRAEQET